MERIRQLISFILLVVVSVMPLLGHAKVLSCDATKGDGKGWIPREFRIDLANDRKTAQVISPITEVFGAKPFEKSFLGSSLWSRGKGKSDRGDYYNYQLQLDLDSNDTEARIRMTMQGYRDNELQFRCVSNTSSKSETTSIASRINRLDEKSSVPSASSWYPDLSDDEVCYKVHRTDILNYKREARSRGLACPEPADISIAPDMLCASATTGMPARPVWTLDPAKQKYVDQARAREWKCGTQSTSNADVCRFASDSPYQAEYEQEAIRRKLNCNSKLVDRISIKVPAQIKLSRGTDQSLQINFEEQTAYVKNGNQWFQKVLTSVKRERAVGIYMALIPQGSNCGAWIDSNKPYYETSPASVIDEGIQIKGLSFLANTSPESRPDLAFYVREVMPDSSGAWACSSFGNWSPNQRNQLMSYLSGIGAKDPIASLKKKDSEFDYGDELDKTVCFFAVRKTTKGRPDWYAQSAGYVTEAKRRGFTPESCYNLRILATSDSTGTPAPANVPNIDLASLSNDVLCMNLGGPLADQAKRELEARETNCDIGEEAAVVSETIDTVEPEELKRLRERLAQLESKQASEQQAISQDTQSPSIQINTNSDGARGTISGTATDNTGIAEVLVDGQAVPLDSSGRFSTSTFIPSGGIDVQITAYDLKGLSTTETIRLEREVATQVAKISFDRLNPTSRRVKSNSNAIALIVGVGEYSKTAPAEFADKDAQVFYDYAHLKLGIPQNRIQTLVNDKADEVGLLTGVNKWLKRSVKQGESDVYIFFAGHGLASDDGDTAYLIPYDGAPDFLERTAISRDEVFREVSSVNPRSVTVFLDTCYSGDTRGESRLIAGRPLGIKLQEQSLPAGFTVLTAAGGDQIAKPLKEAQHGMFSYFLMKGMEGDADANSDNQITARELHAYVRENVIQQSGGSQVPELQGDGEKVLVRFR